MRKRFIWWLVAANVILWAALMGFMAAEAGAQSVPPTQSINTNAGISCNALSGSGAVNRCAPATTYGCTSTATSNRILDTDGNRTSIQFQNTGAAPIVLVFGDTAVGNNGFVVQPGIPYLWSNLGGGNVVGRVATTAVSVISSGASSCAFLFTD